MVSAALAWVGSALVAIAAWFGVNAIGRPLLAFWDDRRAALETLAQHGLVSSAAPGERILEAKAALRAASSRLSVYAQAGPPVVAAYARLRGYNLRAAARAFNGVHETVGETFRPGEGQRNTGDYARLCLGATALLSRERIADIRQMAREADAAEHPG